MANLFGFHFDPTPGFDLGITSGVNKQINSVLPGQGTGSSAPKQTSSQGPGILARPKADSGNTTAVSGGTALGASTGPTAADLSAYNTYRGQANSALGDLLNQYDTTTKSLNSKYDTMANQDQSNYNQTKSNYDQAVTGQNQDLLRQTNQDREGVSHAYQNLLDMLGAYGGGASSVALQWAPNAAESYQNKLVNGDQSTTAHNLASLAGNFGTFQNQFDQQKKQEADQRAQDIAQANQDYNQTKGRLNDLLGYINNQSLDPGTIGTKLDEIQASIPNNVYVKPSYNGTSPVYQAPSLASFESNMPTASISSNVIPGNSSATPALYYLLNQQQKNNGTVVPVNQRQNQVLA
jgi:hypothetical protein